MASMISTGRLAAYCARRARLVVVLWFVALLLVVGGAVAFGGKPESVRGDELRQERMPSDQSDSEPVIVRSRRLTVD